MVAKCKAVRKPGAVSWPLAIDCRCKPAIPQLGQPRVRNGAFAFFNAPVDSDTFIAGNFDLAAQSIEREPFDEIVSDGSFAIYQYIVSVGPYEEIEHRLALRAQQRSVGRQIRAYIIGDEPLQECAHILALILCSHANDGAA